MIIDLLNNESSNIPEKIQYLYNNCWYINPLNHKWVKDNVELNLNDAYCVQKYRNTYEYNFIDMSIVLTDTI